MTYDDDDGWIVSVDDDDVALVQTERLADILAAYIAATEIGDAFDLGHSGRLDLLKVWLREEQRLKHGCDYAIASKYGRVRVATFATYRETIQEYAHKLGITIDEWFFFKE